MDRRCVAVLSFQDSRSSALVLILHFCMELNCSIYSFLSITNSQETRFSSATENILWSMRILTFFGSSDFVPFFFGEFSELISFEVIVLIYII